MFVGVDSWYPPTQSLLDTLKVLDGFTFYGGYVGGDGLWLTEWPKHSWDLIRENDLKPLPIWVPIYDLCSDPIDEAHKAMRACRSVGLSGAVAIDCNSHKVDWLDACFSTLTRWDFMPIHHTDKPVSTYSFNWLVEWGRHELIPGPHEAIQYGPYPLDNYTVVADAADEHFPFARFESLT